VRLREQRLGLGVAPSIGEELSARVQAGGDVRVLRPPAAGRIG
jgi:hypothetical protein